jgi:hypothetical protein
MTDPWMIMTQSQHSQHSQQIQQDDACPEGPVYLSFCASGRWCRRGNGCQVVSQDADPSGGVTVRADDERYLQTPLGPL